MEPSLEEMIQHQLVRRGIRDHRVLDAMQQIDRGDFVPPGSRHLAYRDGPLPLVKGQTISQPYIVALMSQLLETGDQLTCLEIGSGSGYQTAILARLCKSVISIETVPQLHQMAATNLDHYQLDNVQLVLGDGRNGMPDHAPFDRIMVTAAPAEVPEMLLDQLEEDGIMVIPLGSHMNQTLFRIHREGSRFHREAICGVLFVPLI